MIEISDNDNFELIKFDEGLEETSLRSFIKQVKDAFSSEASEPKPTFFKNCCFPVKSIESVINTTSEKRKSHNILFSNIFLQKKDDQKYISLIAFGENGKDTFHLDAQQDHQIVAGAFNQKLDFQAVHDIGFSPAHNIKEINFYKDRVFVHTDFETWLYPYTPEQCLLKDQPTILGVYYPVQCLLELFPDEPDKNDYFVLIPVTAQTLTKYPSAEIPLPAPHYRKKEHGDSFHHIISYLILPAKKDGDIFRIKFNQNSQFLISYATWPDIWHKTFDKEND